MGINMLDDWHSVVSLANFDRGKFSTLRRKQDEKQD